ncbi:hypothetical protein WJX72_001627 [[Myrmecia] bisecta]|uniref:Major facilitator superfamily (MFS) profile domain-containing protein n=1 Tax=[Myrmecia] bisecta TaxID=41462 RepID=A0AAW1PW53_9CHLO
MGALDQPKGQQPPAGKYEEPLEDAAIPEIEFDAPTVYSSHPILGFLQWVCSWVVPGLGMFSEAYFIFSVGNLKDLFTQEYPKCWKTHKTCPQNLLDSVSYSQIAGIILGMIILSFFADRLGRKVGSITTATIMLVGGILLTASKSNTDKGVFVMYVICQAIFGFGVGGEYPIAASSAAERAQSQKAMVHRRGETVVLVFSMQGWGNLVNTLVILICLLAWGQEGPTYNAGRLDAVWRLSTGLGLIPILFMLYWRIFRLRESSVWTGKREKLRKDGVGTAFTAEKLWALTAVYWHRLVGTGMGWFVWDFAFYGNKLFQGTFIKIITPKAGLVTLLEWTLLNSAVALVGYYFAAFTVDKRWMGRTRMQVMGFTMMFILFLCCAAGYEKLLLPGNIHAFQFLYYLSSFFGQWGPNATTWLLAGELYPTEVRALGHGISAALGKAGALVAGFVFNAVSNQTKFYISAFCGLAGVVVTLAFIPDLTGMDLREGDRYWLDTIEGRHDEYQGEAVNPRHLSMFERYVLRRGRRYNPEAEAARRAQANIKLPSAPKTAEMAEKGGI